MLAAGALTVTRNITENDKNLSPYAFTKSKNLELLENLKQWFGFKYEVIYFYNVYGPRQICTGDMATVIGIFETQYKKKLPLSVVKPGLQTRRFTHITDTVQVCYDAWKSNKCAYYSISNTKSYSINEVAKMFKTKISYLPSRLGERYASALTNMSLNNKVIKKFGWSFRLAGFDALNYCLLAEGTVDAVIEANLKPYDILPLIPIIKNSGAIVTNWKNEPAENGGNILATSNKVLHTKILKLLKPFTKKS